MSKGDPSKRETKSGRVTPKGTVPGRTPTASRRYTPPVPESTKVSPRWVPFVMFGLLGLGLLMILTNYMGILPGGVAPSPFGHQINNLYLLVGLFLVMCGIVAATQYR